jgi:hypothetical protein
VYLKEKKEEKNAEIFTDEEDENTKLIAGEVKCAIGVRMLAGGSYLNLVPLFDVSSSHLYNIFADFLKWVLRTFQFPLVRWLRERQWHELYSRASYFAEKSNGIFYGPFAANDGIAI